MNKNKKLVLGLTAAFVGCAAILPLNTFAKEYHRPAAVVRTSTATTTEAGADIKVKGMTYAAFSMESFEDLVKDGIISQDTADKVKSFFEAKEAEMKAEMDKIKDMSEEELKAYFESNGEMKRTQDPYEQMVQEKIITAKEKEDILKYYNDKRENQIKEELNASTQRYVSEGIMNEETAKKVYDFLLNERTTMSNSSPSVSITRGEINDNTISITKAADQLIDGKNISVKIESGNLIASNDDSVTSTVATVRISHYKSLTDAGIITADQEKAMEESDIKYMEHQRKEAVNSALLQLVKDGTLTQEKADKVTEFLNSMKNKNAREELTDTIIRQEGDAELGEVNAVRAFNIFDTLVEEGILTQSESDAVSKALEGTFKGGGMFAHTIMIYHANE